VRKCILFFFVCVSILALTPLRQACSQDVQPAPAGTTYLLHAKARTVLIDVSVTDEEGHPVRGLDRSAFQLFDDGKLQKLTSFEPHAWQQQVASSLPARSPDTYSNDFLAHPPAVFNVMMLDTATIDVADQLFLNEELTAFIKNLPAAEQLAIFVHAGEYTVLLQNFTADHDALLAALAKGIPRLQQQGAKSAVDIDALNEIAAFLEPLPGRKNVMWFTAGSNLSLVLDPVSLATGPTLQAIYDKLEHARIALYPIDVRGPVQGDQSSLQKALLVDQAEATGGQVYLNTNGLAASALRVVQEGATFYTLSYALVASKLDNAWHQVRVKVSGHNYHLSYRRGYYDDDSSAKQPEKAARTLLTQAGDTVRLPENRSEPIIFSAKLTPMKGNQPPSPSAAAVPALRHGEQAYTLHYRVPIAALSHTATSTGEQIQVVAGVNVVNSFGRVVSRASQAYTLSYAGDKLEQNPDGTISFDQIVALPKGEDYLSVVAWDMKSGRTGTLQVPIVIKD
jgi:VWFA-related protein